MIELFQTLGRIGRATGYRSGLERVRAIGLYVAALAIGFSLTAGVLAYGEHTGSYQLNSRGVVPERPGADERPTLLWRETTDTLRDGHEFQIVFVTPLTSNAAPPPGVASWPQRGEVWMSPALRKVGVAEGLEQRYGRTVGTIARHGLVDSSELLAYIRPVQDLSAGQARPVVRFALPQRHRLMSWEYPRRGPEWVLHPALLGAILLSGLWLLFVAARVRSPGLDHRAGLVANLGGRWVHRAVLVTGQVLPLTFTGILNGVLLVPFAAVLGVTGLLTGDMLAHNDLSVVGRTAVVVVLSWLVTPVLAAVFDGLPRRPRTVPVGGPRIVVWWAAACPVMVLFTWYGPDLLSRSVPWPVTSGIGVLGTALTLPAVVALATAGLGRLWAYQGRVRGRASHLVGGRQAAAHPGSVAWLTAVVTIGVCLWSQFPVWQVMADFEAQRKRSQSSVADVAPRGRVTESQVEGFLSGLPSGTRAVVMYPDPRVLRFQGRCEDLRSLALPCPDQPTNLAEVPTRVRDLVARHGRSTGPRVRVASDSEPHRTLAQDPHARLILVAQDGHPLSIPALKRLAFRALPLGAAVEHPEVGPPVAPGVGGGRWPIGLVVMTIVVIATAAGLVGAERFLRRARLLARLTVFGNPDSVLRSSATWWVLMPVTLAGLVGTAMAALLAVPMAAVSVLSVGLILACAGLTFGLGFVITEWVALVAIHETGSRHRGGAVPADSGGEISARGPAGNPVGASRIGELYRSPARDIWG